MARPRLGFLGVGWIGRNRMEAVARSGVAEIAGVADASPRAVEQALSLAPDAAVGNSLEDLLTLELDGVVIATPSAAHPQQAIAALEKGCAVFCQKPLARTLPETQAVIEAARRADRLLAVDFSYRLTEGMQKVKDLARSGELGEIYTLDLVFHNAYGPDKPWFYDPKLSGGGCLMDLGIHLVDLALWLLDFPEIVCVSRRLFAGGRPLGPSPEGVEDYALAEFRLGPHAVARLACSWNLPAGQDAVIEVSLYGTKGGASFRNVNGSFYDFTAERFQGTARELLASPPDPWGGRAAVAWAERLASGERYDPESERLRQVAQGVDAVYGR